MWNNSYRTPTERWQKTSDFPKGKKLPTYLGRAKEKRDKRTGMGPAPLGRSCEGGKFSTCWEATSLVEMGGGGGKALEPWRRAQNQGCRGQSGEIPTQRISATSTHQPGSAGLVCSSPGVGGGWELRLGLQRSDPGEKTGVGCMNTA